MDVRTLSTLPGDSPWELPGKVRSWNILEAKGFFLLEQTSQYQNKWNIKGF